MTTQQHNLNSFAKESGTRFRMTKQQTARVSLTALSDEDRQGIAGLNDEEAADFFNARSPSGKPLGWVKEVASLAANWTEDNSLTRDGAFQEFLLNDGPTRLQQRKPEVPVSVWLDSELNLDNFEQKTLAATGHKIRFRIRKEQTARGLSRVEALSEIVAQARESVNTNQEN